MSVHAQPCIVWFKKKKRWCVGYVVRDGAGVFVKTGALRGWTGEPETYKSVRGRHTGLYVNNLSNIVTYKMECPHCGVEIRPAYQEEGPIVGFNHASTARRSDECPGWDPWQSVTDSACNVWDLIPIITKWRFVR